MWPSGPKRLRRKWLAIIFVIIFEIFLLVTYIVFSVSNTVNEPSSCKNENPKPSPSQKPLITQGQYGEDPDPEIRRRRDFVKAMMKDAWDDYVRYAWGKNELKPVSRTGQNFGGNARGEFGVTIIDSLDTLYIMGMMEEFERARDFVANLAFRGIHERVSLFELNIRIVGGLLSTYALTKDQLFLAKARELAELLLPAFNTPTGLPHNFINLNGNQIQYSNGEACLAELGSFHLEFMYLSEVSRNAIFRDKVLKIRDVLKNIPKPKMLTMSYVNVDTGKFTRDTAAIGAYADSYYEYLLKSSIQLQDWEARQLYDQAMDAFENNSLIQVSATSGLLYIAEYSNGRINHVSGHLACFAGGMFALGAYAEPTNRNAKRDAEIGRNFTNTCHESYIRTETGIGPETFWFNDQVEASAQSGKETSYILRPEVIESYFVLFRATGDKIYRDWGWEAAEAIQKYTKVGPGRGYSGISNVNSTNSQRIDVQESFFLAETLKYLYLLFSTNDVISLDQWVFNTEAHPLPIKGANPNF